MSRRLVTAYRRDGSGIVQIPEHWLGHPTLGAPYTKTDPRQQTEGKQAKGPAPEPPAPGSKASTTPAAGDTKE